jgi:drug/metabolite transporter (DMT)-like permease
VSRAALRETMQKYFFIGATLGLTICAQVVMRWRAVSHVESGTSGKISYLIAMYTDPLVLTMLGFAVAASVCWSLALQRTPLTIAYPFMALSFALVPLASVVFLRETLSWLQIVGIALIVLGVALSASSQSKPAQFTVQEPANGSGPA